MPTSRRERFLDDVVARLQAITVANGFSTDAGLSVHLGYQPVFGPDDPAAAIVVIPGDDEVGQFQLKGFITLPLSIQSVVAVTTSLDLGTGYRDSERALADIKRAMELDDRNFGGLLAWHGIERGVTQTLPREPGSLEVGVAIEYRAPMHEKWGAP